MRTVPGAPDPLIGNATRELRQMASKTYHPGTDYAVRPMTSGGAQSHRRLLTRHGVRVVRLLPLRLAGRRSSAPNSSPSSTRPHGNIFALLAFAAGFLVRPFGALIFGRLGDLVGRKYTFLVTIGIMGLSTFLVGLLPTADSIGLLAR